MGNEKIVTFERSRARLTCFFYGRMDGVNSTLVENEVFDRIVEEGTAVRFDLDACAYVSSGFLRLCVKCARAVVGDPIEIVNARKSVKEVFDMTGLGRIFNVKLKDQAADE